MSNIDLVKKFTIPFEAGEDLPYFDAEEIEIIGEELLKEYRSDIPDVAIDRFIALSDWGLQLHPTNINIHLKRLEVLFGLGMYEDLTDSIDFLIKNEHPTAYFFHLCMRIIDGKIDHFNEEMLQKRNDLDLGYWKYLANHYCNILFQKEKNEFVYDFLQQFINENTETDTGLLFYWALCLENNKEFDRCINIYNRILDLEPFLADAWWKLGQMQYYTKRYKDAINSLEYAHSLLPLDLVSLKIMAHCYWLLKDYKKSMKIAQEAKELEREIFSDFTDLDDDTDQPDDYTLLKSYQEWGEKCKEGSQFRLKRFEDIQTSWLKEKREYTDEEKLQIHRAEEEAYQCYCMGKMYLLTSLVDKAQRVLKKGIQTIEKSGIETPTIECILYLYLCKIYLIKDQKKEATDILVQLQKNPIYTQFGELTKEIFQDDINLYIEVLQIVYHEFPYLLPNTKKRFLGIHNIDGENPQEEAKNQARLGELFEDLQQSLTK